MTIMTTIKFFRLLRGVTQFELSLETKIPSYRLSVLENGKITPGPEELERLAAALQTTPETLSREIGEEAVG